MNIISKKNIRNKKNTQSRRNRKQKGGVCASVESIVKSRRFSRGGGPSNRMRKNKKQNTKKKTNSRKNKKSSKKNSRLNSHRKSNKKQRGGICVAEDRGVDKYNHKESMLYSDNLSGEGVVEKTAEELMTLDENARTDYDNRLRAQRVRMNFDNDEVAKQNNFTKKMFASDRPYDPRREVFLRIDCKKRHNDLKKKCGESGYSGNVTDDGVCECSPQAIFAGSGSSIATKRGYNWDSRSRGCTGPHEVPPVEEDDGWVD